MKPVTIRISDASIKAAENTYGAKVTGCQVAVSGFFEIQKRTLSELNNYFTPNEMSAIADNLNGTMLVPEYQAIPQMLWIHLQDGNEYEGLFQKWNLNEEEFKAKVGKLTSAQVYFLQDAVSRFWNDDSKRKDLKDLVDTFNS